MNTAMWQEIHDQPEVAQKILEEYLPKAEYYRSLLLGKKKLILTGIGASLNACHMARYAFLKYCNLAPQIIQSDELPYVLPSIDRDTLVIFISQSGESYETKVFGKILRERGVEFWGITNDKTSSLARHASEVLLLHSGREISSATKTNQASLLLLDILAAGYDAQVQSELKRLPGLLQKTLETCAVQLEPLADRLLGEGQFYILGMGANGATALEGALMMKEKTFIHTAGTSISDFRHGTVEVVEKGLPILLLASGEENRKKAVAHGAYLRGIGASVALCLDGEADMETNEKTGGEAWGKSWEFPVIQAEPCMEILSPTVFLVPLQLLAERVAVKKGLDVDGFRYLSKVVDTYTKGDQI